MTTQHYSPLDRAIRYVAMAEVAGRRPALCAGESGSIAEGLTIINRATGYSLETKRFATIYSDGLSETIVLTVSGWSRYLETARALGIHLDNLVKAVRRTSDIPALEEAVR
jgi:hypothetical protein